MDQRKLKRELITSGDGSHTIKVEALNEHYHSHKGAIAEGMHVFIESGLKAFAEGASIKILEVGFGTGLNALLTAMHLGGRNVKYTGLEAFPLDDELLEVLNYPSQMDTTEAQGVFNKIHKAEWGRQAAISSNFSLEKLHCKLEDFESDQSFDLVYYDAFAPNVQAELWTPEIFKQLFDIMNVNGVLVTYCAKGQVRRDLQSVGFAVERLDGPPGKREMIRARKVIG